jgi:TonB family protein
MFESRRVTRWLVALGAMLVVSRSVRAQATVDTANCEKIVSAAQVDSTTVGLYVSARGVNEDLSAEDARRLELAVGAVFMAPTPLRLSVFTGPGRLHILRLLGGDTTADLRAPTITSTTRLMTVRGDTGIRMTLLRRSLVIGFDSAVISAIRLSSVLLRGMLVPQDGADSLRVDIRVSTDSLEGERLGSANFPRLPVVDAMPLSAPPLAFPAEAKADSLDRGEVVLRMVINRDGIPDPSTVEVVRASAVSFVRAALQALPKQRFRPAKVKGCPVAQEIDFPFAFVLPDSSPSGAYRGGSGKQN